MIDEDELMALIARYEARLQVLEARTQDPPDPTDIQVQNKSFTANEGQHCIAECPPAGMTVTLPRARPQNRNARITFTLRNSNPVRFIAVDGKINGRSSGLMTLPGTFDAISDGNTGWSISALAGGPGATGSVGPPGPAAPGASLFPLCLPQEPAEEPQPFTVGAAGIQGLTGPTGPAGSNSTGSPFDPLHFAEGASDEGQPFVVGAVGPQGIQGATGPAGSSASGSPFDPLHFSDAGQPSDEGFPFIITQVGATGAQGIQGPAGGAGFPVFPPDLSSEEPPTFLVPGADITPSVQPGSFLGLQITAAGAMKAIEITGVNAGENIRFDSWLADATTTGNTPDYPVAAGITAVRLSNAAAFNLQGIALGAGAASGRALFFCTANSSTGAFEHESASEASATRRFKTPGSLSFKLLNNETALVINDTDAGRFRVVAAARARSAVQANGGTISPAETLNFLTTPTTGTVVPTLAVAAGVMGLSYELLSATQQQLDNATVTTNPCPPNLLGFRPGLTSLTAKQTVSAGTGRSLVGNYTIPLGTPVAGTTYLIWGYMTYVRGATATAHGLIFEVLLNSVVVETITTIPAATAPGNYGGLAFCLLTIYTTGAAGTCSIQTTILNQYRTGAAFGFDTSFSTATVAINTTGVGNPFQLSVKMDAIVAATSTNWTNAGCMRIN